MKSSSVLVERPLQQPLSAGSFSRYAYQYPSSSCLTLVSFENLDWNPENSAIENLGSHDRPTHS